MAAGAGEGRGRRNWPPTAAASSYATPLAPLRPTWRCAGGRCCFTTDKPLAWGVVLHDPDLAEAILDRVLERGRHLELRGRSYRTRHLKEEDSPTRRAKTA